MKKINSTNEKFIYFLLIFTPIIDLLNGIFVYILKIQSAVSPGQVIRMLILCILIYMYIKQTAKHVFILAAFILVFGFQEFILYFNGDINFIEDITFISKIWINLFFILFLIKYYSVKELTVEKVMDYIINAATFVGGTLLITKMLDIGVSSYGDAGYKGLFMGLNDITAVITIGMPFVLYKMIYAHKKLKYTCKFLVILSSLFMLGTKTGLVAAIILTVYYVVFGIRGKRRYIKRVVLIALIIILAFIFLKYFYTEFSNTILKRQQYFVEQLDLVSYLLSGRNELLLIAFEYWKTNLFYIFLGVGFTQGNAWLSSFVENHGMIEMDMFDIMYFYGITMFSVFIYILLPSFIRVIKQIIIGKDMEKKTFFISYFVAFIVSFLGGHVILSPLAGTYFAIVLVYSQKLLRRE